MSYKKALSAILTVIVLCLASCSEEETALQKYVETQPKETTAAITVETEVPFNALGVYVETEEEEPIIIDYESYRTRPTPNCIKVSHIIDYTRQEGYEGIQRQDCNFINLCVKFNGITLNLATEEEFEKFIRSSGQLIRLKEDAESRIKEYVLKAGTITFCNGMLQHLDSFGNIQINGYTIGDRIEKMNSIGKFNLEEEGLEYILLFDALNSATIKFGISEGVISSIEFNVVATEIERLYSSLEDIGYAPIVTISEPELRQNLTDDTLH